MAMVYVLVEENKEEEKKEEKKGIFLLDLEPAFPESVTIEFFKTP